MKDRIHAPKSHADDSSKKEKDTIPKKRKSGDKPNEPLFGIEYDVSTHIPPQETRKIKITIKNVKKGKPLPFQP